MNNYPNYMTPVPLTNPYSASNQNTGIIWVQGLEAAKAYPVASGSSVLLMDSEETKFYIKSTDLSGMPQPIRIFNYTEESAKPQPQYVTKEELDKALAELKKGKKPDKYNKEKD